MCNIWAALHEANAQCQHTEKWVDRSGIINLILRRIALGTKVLYSSTFTETLPGRPLARPPASASGTRGGRRCRVAQMSAARWSASNCRPPRGLARSHAPASRSRDCKMLRALHMETTARTILYSREMFVNFCFTWEWNTKSFHRMRSSLLD